MRYPEFLKDNGRIGFIAPSFGCTTEPYMSLFGSAKKRLEGLGFETVTGPNCFASEGFGKSNTPEACGAEINTFFTEDRCDAIISCGGGETMVEDLNHVDFDAIAKARPKWFMGYSDNTNLTFTLPTLADTAAIYGSCISDFGMETLHPALTDALDVMRGRKMKLANYDSWQLESLKSEEEPYIPYNTTEPYNMRVWLPGTGDMASREDTCAAETSGAETCVAETSGAKTSDIGSAGSMMTEGRSIHFSGRLIGGCLDCLMILAGTAFDKTHEFAERYKDDGIIWFIESCDLTSIGVRRALWQLDNAGWFEHVKGFLIGRPGLYGDESFRLSMYDAVVGQLAHFNVPILMDLDIGHMPPRIPIISGACCDVSTDGRTFGLEYRFV